MQYKLWKIGKELWELGDLASWNIEYVYTNLLIAKKKKTYQLLSLKKVSLLRSSCIYDSK